VTVRRALSVCGVVAGPFFLGTATIEGATSTDYHPVRHPISSLALGPRGWLQTTNFALTGALYLAGAAGLMHRRSAAAVLGTTGSALLLSAAFATDPVNGYPPGTPDTPDPSSRTGTVHNLSAVPIFLGLPAVQLVAAVRSARGSNTGWAAYSAASAGGMLVGFVGSSVGFSGSTRWQPYGGLFQRLTVVSGLGWLTALVAIRTLGSQTI
jgi:hypothetical protein